MNKPTTQKKQRRNTILATKLSRLKIGFLGKQNWISSPAIYTKSTLSIAGHPVMEDWERKYMKVLSDIACSKGGNILEVGYGMGISANFILSNKKIDSHTVIECHPQVLEKCMILHQDEIKNKKLFTHLGFWQDVVPKLKQNSFDGILFDTYPLSAKEIHCNHFSFFKQAHRILVKGGILTYYSDEKSEFSKEHLHKLQEAGFSNYQYQICNVNPPKNCKYWNSKTILAPIITK